jgi:CHAD domain-containing protein
LRPGARGATVPGETSVSKPTNVPGLSRRTRLAVAAPLLVRARLADVRRHEPALARDGEPDEDAVHDMRVAARRLRAALEALADDALSPLEDEVKALQDALGAVRDLQVLRGWIREHGQDGGGADALVREVASRVPDEARRLSRALRAWSGAVAPTIQELSAIHAGGPGRLGGPHVARAVRRRLDAMATRIAPVLDEPAPRAAHRLRIAAKKVRYLAEVAKPGRPAAAKALLATLEPLQERLGDLHDADVRAERLEALARTASTEAQDAARALLEEVRHERERGARALVQDLQRWRDDDLVGALRRGFKKRERRIPPIIRPANGDAARGDSTSAVAGARA